MHVLFHRHGILPDTVYNKEPRMKTFIYGSLALQLEEEQRERKLAELRRD